MADACILVKDVVSNVFYDLHAAGQIELYWTPGIEAGYIKHRARIRAQDNRRALEDADLIWASTRIDVIKKHLVKQSTPADWEEADALSGTSANKFFAPLHNLPDQDDIHVAIGAAYLARNLGRAVVLVTGNVTDLPPETLKPFNLAVMHQGGLLELIYNRNAKAVSRSILKTSRDFSDIRSWPISWRGNGASPANSRYDFFFFLSGSSPDSIILVICHCCAIDKILLTTQ